MTTLSIDRHVYNNFPRLKNMDQKSYFVWRGNYGKLWLDLLKNSWLAGMSEAFFFQINIE